MANTVPTSQITVNGSYDNFPALDNTSPTSIPPGSHIEQAQINTSAAPIQLQPSPAQKRAHESTLSSDVVIDEVLVEDDQNSSTSSAQFIGQRKIMGDSTSAKHVMKKPKNEDINSNKSGISDTVPISAEMSVDKYNEFVTRSKGCTNFSGLVAEYTDDIDNLISMVEASYDDADKQGKSSLTRLKKKLSKLQNSSTLNKEEGVELDHSSSSTLNSTQSAGTQNRSVRSSSISSI
ncbi:hypothetical protein QAD02_000010 [Eretmocerus hayati]|uniref:Uncharacterized protein n=1 Tax=Eretmocerus hayati TaxID=131215 RepID=A0ACC2NCD2_9HYME|nr:hypothetical protein QAD02_000010 [Eretmocerus hayati]